MNITIEFPIERYINKFPIERYINDLDVIWPSRYMTFTYILWPIKAAFQYFEI